jgi:hypothetical protein
VAVARACPACRPDVPLQHFIRAQPDEYGRPWRQVPPLLAVAAVAAGGFAGGGGHAVAAAVARGGGGGGRRSDIALKHDVVLWPIDNGLGYYRFSLSSAAKGLCRRDGAGGKR